MTGSYNNVFRILNRDPNVDVSLEASRDNIATATHILDPINFISGKLSHQLFLLHEHSYDRICILGAAKPTSQYDLHIDTMDYSQKILHASWNPRRNIVALAATNNLYLFRQ
jgi:serine/threonine-protein phosphatase 2A regulatory subunit B